jgi:F-type H+-transporting ATPase subunit epsilon
LSTIKLEIVTPERKVLEQDVEIVIAKGSDGELGILPQHIAMVTPLRIAPLRYKQNGKEHAIAVQGGFLEIRGEKVVVLAESAELPTEIDVDRAEKARQRAEGLITQKAADTDLVRAEQALKRALNRIEVANIK